MNSNFTINGIKPFKLIVLIAFVLSCTSCKQTEKRQYNPSLFERELQSNIKELTYYAKEHSSFSANEVKLENTNYIKYDLLPSQLKEKYDVKFYGDAKRFIGTLSNYCGFKFLLEGVTSSSSNNIFVNLKDAMLVDILSTVGAQLSNDISLNLDVDVVNESFSVKIIYPNK